MEQKIVKYSVLSPLAKVPAYATAGAAAADLCAALEEPLLPRNFYRRTVFLRLKADTAEPFLMSSGKNRRKSVNILITQIGINRSISSAS